MSEPVDKARRRFLTVVTSGVGAVGGVLAATPFVLNMTPSERAKAAGAPVKIDISKLQIGQMIREEWQGKPVWVINRSDTMMASLAKSMTHLRDPASAESSQPQYAKNDHRSRDDHKKILVLLGICTHLGCAPVEKFAIGPGSDMGADWPGGFFCPCHGSKFDMSGRVYKNVPAPRNLPIPPYKFLSDTEILVGDDKEAA